MEYLKIDIFAWKRLKLLTATILNLSTMQYSLYGDNIQAEKSNKHKCLHFGKCNITTEDTTGVFL